MSKAIRRALFLLVPALLVVASVAAAGNRPGRLHARPTAVHWYQKCATPMNGYDQDEICLQWTGSWPNGRVRAEAPQWYAGVRLLVCGCRPLTDKWVVKGTQLTEKPPVWDYKTAAYAVGKIAYYKVCARYPVGRQGWQCWSNGDAHYLGD